MPALPDPQWPVLLLVAIVAADAVMSLKPAPFIAACYVSVRLPRRIWPMLVVIKVAAIIGLFAGLWIPWLGLVTSACLILYFVLAISAHIRVGDFGRTLFLNAGGMLVINTAVLIWCFLV